MVAHVIDQTSPYYLHASDQSSNLLVSQPLNGDNYPTWCQAFTMAIQAKNKLGFIDGNLKNPAANSLDFDAWTRCNSMVQSWLVQSAIPTISNSILWIEDAYAVWIDLRDHFPNSILWIEGIHKFVYAFENEHAHIIYFSSSKTNSFVKIF
ncbi:UBN2_3 domain-containing protein [Cephalotus follicularis]|uniref:UBN2_3 domain-containing protein n=1 Tax=Cephalotus follicularis TaxID=3775 RepID=A0A1Q3CGN1_CEPFO|nr:UBN2_3 domain-containing protein [Cephalotus follicularis]